MTVVTVLVSATTSMIISQVISRLLRPDLALYEKFVFGLAIKDLILPVIATVIAVAISSIASNTIARPVRQASDAACDIAAGVYSTRLPENGGEDEISTLQRNFNLMAAELEGNELLKKDFTANISHQFKTPLAIIQGYARLLEEDNITEEDRKRYAALITRESGRLAKLSSNMLRLSRLENQEIIASPKRFLLSEQIVQSIVLLEPQWMRRNISFNVDLPEIWFVGDEELLEQVWFNLVENAVKFSREGGEITVDAASGKDSVTVTVADEGEGMSAETCTHIFRRYYQGKSSASHEGSGLGLSIVKRIVDLHGGNISVRSTQGKGTCFEVILPVLSYDSQQDKIQNSRKADNL